MIHVVSISDLKISDKKEDLLITYSLGSCIGVTLYDKASGIGGMFHALLPQAKMNPRRAEQNPFIFVDSGFSRMVDEFKQRGVHPQNLICKVAGGGKFLDPNDVFKTGEKNYAILQKMLWKNKIVIAGEDVGGAVPRTMILCLESGETAVRIGGKEKRL